MKKSMADRIQEVIDELELTLEAFGKPIGVTKESVWSWVNGKTKNLRPYHLFKIEDVYGINSRWIVLGELPKHLPKINERPPAYSPQTKAIADLVETLDEEGKKSIQSDVEKEKRYQALKLKLNENNTLHKVC